MLLRFPPHTIAFKVWECFASLISFQHHPRPHLLHSGFLRFLFVAGLLGPIAIIAIIAELKLFISVLRASRSLSDTDKPPVRLYWELDGGRGGVGPAAEEPFR